MQDPNQDIYAPGPDTIPPPEQNRKLGFIKLLLSWTLVLLVAWFIQRFVFQSYQVFGQSMSPALSGGDFLIVSKIPNSWAQIRNNEYVPARGDIVVLNEALVGERLIKRVIGLPGERIEVSDGKVTIYNQEKPNGFDPYKELHLNRVPTDGQVSLIVPAGRIFVIGDNRKAGGSLDSRNELGPVPTEMVIGELVVRIWPISQLDLF